jgi:adenylate cyclase
VRTRDAATSARLESAFAREERRGLMLAAAARSAAVAVLIVWVAASNLEHGLAQAWVVGTATIFLVTGLAQLGLYRRGSAPAWAPYAFVLIDSWALAAVLVMPNPFWRVPLPPALPFRFASFLYFFVLLMQMTFSFRPALLLWTGVCGAGAWAAAFVWVQGQPGVITERWAPDLSAVMRVYFDPNFVSGLKVSNEIVVFLVVSAGLAVLVRRSRSLVAERAAAERERANLARYFSPKVVDVLAERDQPLGRGRRQPVGVLFADLVGFTTLAESMTPEEVLALLRGFHARMEDEVFRHGGCLEKFIGDALLATFGVPDTGPRDAADTLDCARGMLRALERWNGERAAAGAAALRMGLGLHYGPAVLGDIGSERSMAFATVGDTINVASRLQALTRELGADLVASGDLVAAVRRQSGDPALLAGLAARGAHALRGRDHPIEIWA